MANLSGALQQLREEHKKALVRLDQLNAAISAVEGVIGQGRGVWPTSNRRTMSASDRRRIAAAQRKRWARVRAARTGKKNQPSRKRTLSPSARRRIVAAQKKRWAKFRAGRKAA